MAAYAYPIHIDRTPQKIHYRREIVLPCELLTLDDIDKHLEAGQKFSLECSECGSYVVLIVCGYTLETTEQVDARVAKAEAYNKKRDEFNAKYRNK